jgi:ABC-type dipeptide/oligopeptide/nickel transport system permease component
MAALIARRLLALPVLLLGVSVVVFVVSHLVPGDPARVLAGPFATETDVERLRTVYGLDRPLAEQYLGYLGRVVQGDLGKSFRSQRPVLVELGDRLPATIELTAAALLIGVPLGLWLGVSAARRQNGLADNVATLGSIAGISVPLFWIGLMLAALFGVALQWLPFSGRTAAFTDLPRVSGLLLVDALLANDWAVFGDGLKHLVLPAITLAVAPLALVSRVTRASFIEVLRQDYIRTARAYGFSEPRIMRQHAARNALLPLVTLLGVLVPSLLNGAVLTETVFSWPGVGTLLLNSIAGRDYAVIQGAALLFATFYVLANLLVDISYAWLDPRTREA